MPLPLHGFADFANYQLPEIGSSVSIRIPRSPYAALFLFTARQRSDVLTQEWRAAATAAPFD